MTLSLLMHITKIIVLINKMLTKQKNLQESSYMKRTTITQTKTWQTVQAWLAFKALHWLLHQTSHQQKLEIDHCCYDIICIYGCLLWHHRIICILFCDVISFCVVTIYLTNQIKADLQFCMNNMAARFGEANWMRILMLICSIFFVYFIKDKRMVSLKCTGSGMLW